MGWIEDQIDAIRKVGEEACRTPGTARKFLRDAGIDKDFITAYQFKNSIKLYSGNLPDYVKTIGCRIIWGSGEDLTRFSNVVARWSIRLKQ